MKDEELKQKKLRIVHVEMNSQAKALEEVSEKMLGLQLMSWALLMEGLETAFDGWKDYLEYCGRCSDKTRNYISGVLTEVASVKEKN